MLTTIRILAPWAALGLCLSACNPQFLPAPQGAQLSTPSDIELGWSDALNQPSDSNTNNTLPPVAVLTNFFVSDVNDIPIQRIAVQVSSGFEGVFLLPAELLEARDYSGEGEENYTPFALDSDLFLSDDGEEAFRPTNVEIQTDRQGVASVLVVIDYTLGSEETDFQTVQIFGTIGVASTLFNINFVAPEAG